MDHGFMDSEGTLKRNQKRCMRFRKHCSLLAECEIYTFLLAVLCVSMIEIHSWIVVITSIMLLLMAIYPILFNEYILISESGICCTKQQKIQWSFSWEDISELRKSRRFHQNSIDIIISNTSVYRWLPGTYPHDALYSLQPHPRSHWKELTQLALSSFIPSASSKTSRYPPPLTEISAKTDTFSYSPS